VDAPIPRCGEVGGEAPGREVLIRNVVWVTVTTCAVSPTNTGRRSVTPLTGAVIAVSDETARSATARATEVARSETARANEAARSETARANEHARTETARADETIRANQSSPLRRDPRSEPRRLTPRWSLPVLRAGGLWI
jgi:hypothetical protein